MKENRVRLTSYTNTAVRARDKRDLTQLFTVSSLSYLLTSSSVSTFELSKPGSASSHCFLISGSGAGIYPEYMSVRMVKSISVTVLDCDLRFPTMLVIQFVEFNGLNLT
jgi:hypothetical protein